MRKSGRLRTAVIVALLAMIDPTMAASLPANAPTIAAASDLKFALEDIAAQYRKATRQHVKLVFGSSGNFYRQIAQGAPFEVFMSADESLVYKLAEAGKLENRGDLYAIGRIVLFVPHGSTVGVDAQLASIKTGVERGSLKRLAIANPEHAPYGRAAEQALRKAGAWDVLRGKLVLGENVSQAAQFATSGSAEAGIFAYSLAISPVVAKAGRYVLIPDTLHEPLRQRMALIKGAGDGARTFYRFLQSPESRTVFQRYGFSLPSE